MIAGLEPGLGCDTLWHEDLLRLHSIGKLFPAFQHAELSKDYRTSFGHREYLAHDGTR